MDKPDLSHALEQYERHPLTVEELEAERRKAVREAELLEIEPILAQFRPVSIEAERLADVPARQWALEGAIPRGELTILGARKGLGKTWFALQSGAAIASGASFLGLQTFKGLVLYWPSELDYIGLHERACRLGPLPAGFDVMYAPVPRGPDLLGILSAIIRGYQYAVVIIDMLQAALPTEVDSNSYEAGHFLLALRRVAMDTGAAIVGTWHNGKADRDDPVLSLIGSTGIGAQAGSIITIDRKRGDPGAKVYISGNHARERMIRVQFSEGLFALSDEPDEGPQLPASDRRVLDAITARPDGIAASTLAGTIGKAPNAVRAALSRLGERGLVEKRIDKWFSTPAHEAHESAQTLFPCARQGGDESARSAPPPLGGVRSCASPMPERSIVEGVLHELRGTHEP